MEENLNYKIEPFEIATFFFRFLSVTIILLIILNFKINPIAFSILLIFPVLFLLFSRTSCMIVTQKRLIVEHKNIIKSMSKVFIIKIEDIESILFEQEYKPIGRHSLPMSYMLSKDNTLVIKLKDNKTIRQSQIGTIKQFNQAIQILDDLIKKNR